MKKILLAVMVLWGLQMCNVQNADTPEVKLDQEIDLFMADYKNQLGIEKIEVSYSGPYSKLIDTTKTIHVTIFDPPKKADLYGSDVSIEIASKVYEHLINKNDYKRICINYLYANQGPYISGHYRNKRHNFSYNEIQEFVHNLK